MTIEQRAEIIDRAVEKAFANGWKPTTPDDKTGGQLCDVEDTRSYWDYDIWPNEAAHIIFNHDFAKALWGTEGVMGDYGISGLAWIVHLQQMVIADDPVQYLGENL